MYKIPITEEMKSKGNVNSPSYWDAIYKIESESDIVRRDIVRFDLILNEVLDGQSILDFGCALGEFLVHARHRKPRCKLYGVDWSQVALDVCNKRVWNLHTAKDMAEFPADLKFDRICVQHVVEHFDDPLTFCEGLKQRVAPGGLLILVVPINDDEWREHQKIWQVEDVIDLCKSLKYTTLKLIHKETAFRYKDGRHGQEAIAFMAF